MSRVNEFGQPVGDAVDWAPGTPLVPVTLSGRTCRLEPLGQEHLDGLYDALCVDSPSSIWTYMPSGPFADREALAAYTADLYTLPATIPLAILLPDGTPAGIATYLRIDHANGTAEVGYISYSSALQRTTAATEAMYLMAAHAFDVVGVRRYEWKCDSLNEPSRRAAARLGFTFEGVFRKAVVYKGRNRDTAWFAITDDEWPRIKSGFERWLDPANFDEHGQQRWPLDILGGDGDRAVSGQGGSA
jgi:RimJ/RimL family protein N-acetyltransferase